MTRTVKELLDEASNKVAPQRFLAEPHTPSAFDALIAADPNIAPELKAAMSRTGYVGMTDAQLLAEAECLAMRVSIFNAAESAWGSETEARDCANRDFRACRAALQSRGLEFVNDGGYLL